MKKLYLGIFIAIFTIIAMSHNASAIELTLNLNDYEIVRNITRPTLDLYYNGNTTTCSGTANCAPFNSTANYDVRVSRFASNSEWAGNIDDIFILRVLIASQNPNSDAYTNVSLPVFQKNYTTTSGNLLYLGNNITNYDGINIYSTYANTPDLDWYTNVVTSYKNFQVIEYYFQALNSQGFNIGFNSNSSSYNADLFTYYASDANSAYYFKILNMVQYRRIGSAQEQAAEKDLESTENIENQTPPSSSETGDGAAATNLISAFSGFVSALGGLSATNCNMTLNFPEFAGGSRVVNVCQNKDKAGNIISVFSSLTLIVFYVPLAIRLLTMIYNEIRSFTNG